MGEAADVPDYRFHGGSLRGKTDTTSLNWGWQWNHQEKDTVTLNPTSNKILTYASIHTWRMKAAGKDEPAECGFKLPSSATVEN